MTGTHGLTPIGWARVWAAARPFARPMPRAGAWYPVVGEGSGDRVVLRVHDRRVAVQRNLVEIRSDQPKTFSVVSRSRADAAALREAYGSNIEQVYAVCPMCTARARVLEAQPVVTCAECGHRGEVAWWETG